MEGFSQSIDGLLDDPRRFVELWGASEICTSEVSPLIVSSSKRKRALGVKKPSKLAWRFDIITKITYILWQYLNKKDGIKIRNIFKQYFLLGDIVPVKQLKKSQHVQTLPVSFLTVKTKIDIIEIKKCLS